MQKFFVLVSLCSVIAFSQLDWSDAPSFSGFPTVGIVVARAAFCDGFTLAGKQMAIPVSALASRKNIDSQECETTMRSVKASIKKREVDMPSKITFKSFFHRATTVELRSGNFIDCDLNEALPLIVVPALGTKTITTEVSICFRRDADPDNPTGTLTEWTIINIDPPPADAQEINVNI